MDMLIDIHAHLEMDNFENDRDAVLNRAKDAGLGCIITVGSDIEGCEGGVRIASEYDMVYAAIGIHPHDAKDIDEATYDLLRELSRNEKIIAFGETGLDYRYEYSPREIQQQRFREQIRLAKELRLPLIIHNREATQDTKRIMDEENAWEVGGVMHCFSGSLETAREVIARGFYISFAGPVTFKKAENTKNVVKGIPIENILIETDCPYLAPEPFRGKRNEPSYLRYIADAIADIKGLSPEDVARVTTYNAMRLFGIGKIEEGQIVYKIRGSLYLNITNRCTNRCTFCVRYYTDFVKGHHLRLKSEPSVREVIEAIGDPTQYREVVFCGYGEPLIRLDAVKEIARWVKEHGGRIRINTNGQGNLIHGRNILPELKGLVDAISISLDVDDAGKYYDICRPKFGRDTFEKIKEFILEAKKYTPHVRITVLTLPEVDIERCRATATELGVELKIREWGVVG
ncbi:MAG: YchF/TatD family DNA exonuclease [Nitrospirota bacterium]